MSISRVHAASLSFLSKSASVNQASVANRVTGQFEEDILKVGENRAEVSDPDPVFGQTMNHFGYEIVAAAPNRVLRVAARVAGRVAGNDLLDSWDGSKTLRSGFVVCGKDD